MRVTRFFADFDSVVFDWQTKAVPADGVIGIVALLTLGADFDVRELVGSAVTDVNPCSGDAR